MFKELFGLIRGVIRLVVFLAIFAVIFHTWVIKIATSFVLGYNLGARVFIQSVKMDWRNAGFEIQGLEISDPLGHPSGLLADIPLAIVSVELADIPQGILRFKLVGFSLRELRVVNLPGKGLNLMALKPLKGKNEREAGTGERALGRLTQRIVIDEMVMSFATLSYYDETGPSLKQKHFNMGIREATFRDIRGSGDVAVMITSIALKKMGYGFLVNQWASVLVPESSTYNNEGNAGLLKQTIEKIRSAFG